MFNRTCLLRLLLGASIGCATLSIDAQTVSKTFTNQSLKTVLKEIETQTGMSVIYKTDELNKSKKMPCQKFWAQISHGRFVIR